ncbi:MAG: DUF3471 domain-containing protein, partial [Longimicrobiales bacterium]|nr:DUF3471 domain-containing protein [Longimicrobiales bacterium]
QIVENGAQGYMPADDGGWREAADVGGSMGAGGIYTTLGDLARWIDNFKDPTVGGPELFDWMTTRYVLADGDTTDYGLGLFVDEYRGLKRIHHGGADLAHRSMLVYFPELDAGVVVESNNATFNSGATASAVARAFLEDHMEEDEAAAPAVDESDSAAEFDPAQYDPEDFDPLTGRYALAEAPSFVLSFFRDGDTLWTQATGQPRARIEPTSDSTFRLLVVPASVTFHRNPDGTADSLTLHQNGEHLAHRLEGEVWEPTDDELDAYTGRYFSRELETFYTLTLEEGRLTLDHRRFDEPVRLRPGSGPDTFTGSFPVAEVEFVRDASGDVVALEASNGRTRGVRFDRMAPESR